MVGRNQLRIATASPREIAGFVIDRVLQVLSVNVTDIALHDVEHQLETVVNVCVSDRAGCDGGNVHGQFGGIGVLSAEAGLVLDTIPTTEVVTAKHLTHLESQRDGRQ